VSSSTIIIIAVDPIYNRTYPHNKYFLDPNDSDVECEERKIPSPAQFQRVRQQYNAERIAVQDWTSVTTMYEDHNYSNFTLWWSQEEGRRQFRIHRRRHERQEGEGWREQQHLWLAGEFGKRKSRKHRKVKPNQRRFKK